MSQLVRVAVAAGLAASTLVAGVSSARTPAGPTPFSRPVALTTTPGFGGFEPTLTVDTSGNTWVTAHKSYHGQVSPDGGSPAGLRSSSWLWVTRDGTHFTNPPGADAVSLHEQYLGDEGDVAASPDGDVHFVDLGLASSSLASWRTTPAGRITLTGSQVRMPQAVLGSDRPFVAAGRRGALLVVQNQIGAIGVDDTSAAGYSHDPAREIDDDPAVGSESGQAELFVSDDGGRTFTSPLPHIVHGSAFCRPLVDRRDRRKMLVFCTSLTSDALFADRSSDGGTTWKRTVVQPAEGRPSSAYMPCSNFPSVAQSRDGRLHVLCTEVSLADGYFASSRLVGWTSKDFGASWTRRDLTPEPGIWEQGSIAVAPNGRIGVAGYYRADRSRPWQYRAATFSEGTDPVSVEVSAGEPIAPADSQFSPGDFTQIAFGPDNRLRTAFNVAQLQDVVTQQSKLTGLYDVFYSQER